MSDLMICTRCRTRDWPLRPISGTFAVEGLLWGAALLLFLLVNIWVGGVAAVAALAYSVRRYSTRGAFCPACRSAELVPVDSPRGNELLRQSKTASV